MDKDASKVKAADSRERYIVPALAHGLDVLALFSRGRPALTAPEVCSALGLPRATVFRLLVTLERAGYVLRGPDERTFRLGPGLLNRGFTYLASLDLPEIGQPALQRLRDRTGLSAHLAVRDGREVVYIGRVAALTTVASNVQIGTRFPVHATIMGRMLLLDHSDEELRALFPERQLPKVTSQTPSTLAELKEVLSADRERGYGVSQSFFERGVSAVGAPVRDGTNKVIAAVNVTAVDTHIDLDAMHSEIKDAVLDAARDIGSWFAGAPVQMSAAR
ncbi:MAG: IclR family transcriptional regulator [Beijerinckiaceae bacterium]